MLSITSYSLPFRVPGSQKDRQMLHYFCVQGSHDISGFTLSSFWSRNILRESHKDHVVRQALVALSSLHLDYTSTDGATDGATMASTDTLNKYGNALRSLNKRLSKNPSQDTVRTALICSVLFYSFESGLGNSEAAMRHLNSGLKILPSYRGKSWDDDEDLESLSTTFERLDLQATFFDDGRVPCLQLASKERQGDVGDSTRGRAFSGLEDSQRTLVSLQNWLFRFLIENIHYKSLVEKDLPAHILQEKEIIMQKFSEWARKFDDFRFWDERSDQATCTCNAQTLLVQFYISRMLLEASFPNNDNTFGASPNESAETILELADNILRRATERDASDAALATKNLRRSFSSETGIVAPLFVLAMKCLDVSVRERAVKLLRTSQRREGLYDAQTMITIVDKLKVVKRQKQEMNEYDATATESAALEFYIHENETASKGMDSLVI
ncbi:hypothetical protein FQN54_004893 [Arachnomyces sp. PD_36]|nr:hypothetical protein FQN54_004893 [Arachnomyces sp. PD_36]